MKNILPYTLDYLSSHREQWIETLGEFIRIPSVSTNPEHRLYMFTAARWLADYLETIGLQNIQIFPPDSHPIVFGENLDAGPNAPTVLLYGHYDVQPADPLDKWKSDPFELVLWGENLYGRGVSDMKGQIMATIFSLESLLKTRSLPVNIKFLIEGQEEIGSPDLGTFILENKDLLASDFCLNPDVGMLSPTVPAITYALRGLAYFELRIYGPKQDLHSGSFGGIIHNPAHVLCDLIAGMHDDKGRITLPGFYDTVRQIDVEEKEALARYPVDEQLELERTGVKKLWGEAGFSMIERKGARPTLDINGLHAGFTGEGSKTILPAYAMAKISLRLVPDQKPASVREQLLNYLNANTPDTVHFELDFLSSGSPVISDRDSRWIRGIIKSMETTWGVRPIFRREGGSIPAISLLQENLGVESVNIGFSLPNDNIHGPNEKLHFPTWIKGIETLTHFFYNLPTL